MSVLPGGAPKTRYEFLIAGTASDVVRSAFPELTTIPGPLGGAVLYGPVRDRSDLDGLLARFADLGLPVVENDLIGEENVFPAKPSVGAAVSAALDHARVLIGGDNAQDHPSDEAPGD